jgi:hypothetical protein
MASSSDVTANTNALAAQYNNLRKDALRMLALGTTTLTLASDAITVGTDGFYYVDTEGAASTDNLATINGGSAGDVLILRIANAARAVVVKHNTGNIYCAKDITLNSIYQSITLRYDGSISKWVDCDPDYLPRAGGVVSGHTAFGNYYSAVDSTIAMLIGETTTVTSGNFYSLYVNTRAGPASTSTAAYYGSYFGSSLVSAQTVASLIGARYYLTIAAAASGGTVTTMTGASFYGYAASGTTGTITSFNQIYSSADFGDVNIGTYYGMKIESITVNNGIVTNVYNIYAAQPGAATGTGSYTNVYGIYIIEPTRGSTVNKAFVIYGNSGTSNGGIWFYNDTVLYRSAADTLASADKCDFDFTTTATSGTVYGYQFTLTGNPASNGTLAGIAVLGEAAYSSTKNADSLQGGNFIAHVDASGGTFTAIRGIRSSAYGSSGITGTVAYLNGWYTVVDSEDLTTAAARIIWIPGVSTHNGVVTDAQSIYIGNGSVDGTGSITNQYGIYIEEQTLGNTKKYAIYLAGTSYGLGSSLSFAGQCNIYLGAANSLYITADVFRITSTLTGDDDIFQVFSGATQVAQIDARGDIVAMKAKEYGFVLRDRATDAYRRIVSTNGNLSTEAM